MSVPTNYTFSLYFRNGPLTHPNGERQNYQKHHRKKPGRSHDQAIVHQRRDEAYGQMYLVTDMRV